MFDVTNVVIGVLMVLSAWAGVYFSFRSAASSAQSRFREEITNAIKIGVLEARQEILETVDEKHEAVIKRINHIQAELSELRQTHKGVVSRVISHVISISTTVQSVARGDHQAADSLTTTQRELRELL